MARPKNTKNCGRFTGHENDNTEGINKYAADLHEITERAKEIARGRLDRMTYNVDFIPVLIDRLEQYAERCRQSGELLTVGGFILASGMHPSIWHRMNAGEYDHVVDEYRIAYDVPDDQESIISDDGEVIPLVHYSDILQKLAYLPIQIQLEQGAYNTKARNVAGPIFGLKAVCGFRDDPEQPRTVNNTLVIADSAQAKKALEMLQG